MDERRRRRLAAEDDELLCAVSDDANSVPSQPHSTIHPGTEDCATPVGRFPLKKLVSRRLWKLWCVGLTGVIIGAAILAATHWQTTSQQPMSVRLSQLFAPADGRVAAWYGSTLLFLAGQLACLIRWARAQSLQDFCGRYRVWTGVAVICWFFSLTQATSVHLVFGEAIRAVLGRDVPFLDTMSWLIPLAAIAVCLMAILDREMQCSRVGRVVLWITAVGFVSNVVFHLAPLVRPALPFGTLLLTGTSMACALGLFLSILMHARHVLYVSVDPPLLVNGQSVFMLLQRQFARGIATTVRFCGTLFTISSRRSATAARHAVAISSPHAQNDATSSATGSPIANSQPNTSTSADAGPGSEIQTQLPVSGEHSQTNRIDPALDQDQLKGLSKKERRKLRKQWREQQRSDS